MSLSGLASVAALAPAAILAGLAVAALGGAVSARLDALTHFAPLYAVGGLAVLLLATLPQLHAARSGLALAGALAVVSGAVLIGPELWARWRAPSPAPQAGPTLKVIQFNALDGAPDPKRAVDWLLAQEPDVIVLEEGRALLEPLMRRGAYHYAGHSLAAIILSRQAPTRTGSTAPLGVFGDMISYAVFDGPEGGFAVVAAHKSWPIRYARLEVERRALEDVMRGLPRDRVILAGDFNATPWSFGLRRLDSSLGLRRRTLALATWPAGRLSHYRAPAPFPFMPIDHIYAGSAWTTGSVRRGPRIGSDHYPVVVELQAVSGGTR